MRLEYNGITQRPSTVIGSETSSHITVLRPRDYAPSDILSTFRTFLIHHEKETWKHRAKLAFRILSFCLGPGNIWRFPEQSFVHGNATYIYLYIIYSWIFCISLLVFEISLSQYFMKGFAKLFTICPIMEGITLAMALYCVMANYVYNLVGVYSMGYIVSSMSSEMSHSYCSDNLLNYGCQENHTDIDFSPEHLYFHNYVERALDTGSGFYYNWKSAGIIAVTWILLCSVILLGVLKYHWITIILSLMILFCLLYVSIVTATLTGATDGLSRMFIPTGQDIGKLRTWIFPIEQSIVTLGVGAGPLTTIWSLSKIKYWSRLDCVIVNAITFTCSILAGMTFFSAVGVLAHKSNKTIDDLFRNSSEDPNTFVVVTQSLTSLGSGVNNFTVFIYYFVMFGSCLYSLLEYTQIILLYVSSYITGTSSRNVIIITTCLLLFLLITNLGVTRVGYQLMRSINENFMATALLINLCFELISVSCLYGMRNFCDDLDFMLGFVPNYFFQTTWLILPGLFASQFQCRFATLISLFLYMNTYRFVLKSIIKNSQLLGARMSLLVFSIASLYLKFLKLRNNYDLFVWCLTLLFTILPIVAIGTYKCFMGIKEVGLKKILHSRLNDSDWESSSSEERSRSISMYRNINVPQD